MDPRVAIVPRQHFRLLVDSPFFFTERSPAGVGEKFKKETENVPFRFFIYFFGILKKLKPNEKLLFCFSLDYR